MRERTFFRLFIMIVFSLSSGFLIAQEHAIEGVVKDAESGEVIPGVTIQEQGTITGTITDINGSFELTVS
ncbi:MAG TPA: carboxypeptidase-like regulatory domain-containing protein, partial [Bacteroidales bacterium]|nr:carboxypeptidase-like regulatory domain-containing protein [Bacteroidales bacterium]